jgi:O-antigen/teichoic acid export membrane protein
VVGKGAQHPAGAAGTAGAPRGLTDRTARAAIWSFVGFVVAKAFNFVGVAILARLLAPEDFGRLAVVTLVLAFLNGLSNLGVQQAVVQRLDEGPRILNAAFTLRVIRGIALFALLFAGAPAVAGFFDDARLVPLVRAMACVFPLVALENVGVFLFFRRLDFRARAGYEIASESLRLVATVALALGWRDVWALILGQVVGALGTTALSYAVHPFRPRLEWRWDVMRELLSYGKFITGSALAYFVLAQGDNAVVGKLLGSVALGYYSLAYTLALSPNAAVGEALNRVLLPAYASIQSEPARLRGGFLDTRQLAAAAVLPLAVLLAVAAPEVVAVVLGARWAPIVPLLPILCLYGAISALDGGQKTLLRAVGRPDRALYVDLVRVPLFGVLVYLWTVRFGLVGACWAVLVPAMLAQVVAVPLTARALGLRVADLLWAVAGPAAAAALMAGAIVAVRPWLGDAGPVLRLAATVTVGGTLYAGALVVLAPDLAVPAGRRFGIAVPVLLPVLRGREPASLP